MKTRRMTSTTTLWMALAMTVTAVAAAAPPDPAAWGDADDRHARLERFRERRMERLAVVLDLTEQQVVEWQALHESRRGAMEEQERRMRDLHQRIEGLAGAENPDAAAVGELVIEAHRLRQAVRSERDLVHDELLSLLTPEQRDRFEAFRELEPEHDRRGRHGRRTARRFAEGGPAVD